MHSFGIAPEIVREVLIPALSVKGTELIVLPAADATVATFLGKLRATSEIYVVAKSFRSQRAIVRQLVSALKAQGVCPAVALDKTNVRWGDKAVTVVARHAVLRGTAAQTYYVIQ